MKRESNIEKLILDSIQPQDLYLVMSASVIGYVRFFEDFIPDSHTLVHKDVGDTTPDNLVEMGTLLDKKVYQDNNKRFNDIRIVSDINRTVIDLQQHGLTVFDMF